MSDATPAAGTGRGDDDVDLRVAIVQANDGGERSQPGISWVVDHLAAILVAAGIVLSTVIGVAYEFFYGQLGVRSSELGLGTEQILLHGALGVGFVGTFVAMPLAVLVVLALNSPRQPSSSGASAAPDPARVDDPPSVAAAPSARQRIKALLGLVFLSALAAFLFFVSDAPLFGALGAVLAAAAARWLGHVGVEATPERWRAAWDIAIVRYASLLSIIEGAGLLTVAVVEGHDASLVGATAGVIGGIGITLGVLGWRQSRRWAVADPQTGTHRRLLNVRADVVAGVVAMAWLVAYVAVITSGAATLVRKGGLPPNYNSHWPALYSAPIHCVRVHWIEPPAPADLPEHALYLGQAGGTTVLYQAQTSPAGALRLPSARLALTPTAAAGCRPPPSN